LEAEKIISELNFKAVRSSGAGGQNVNKVSSKVVLTFDVVNSRALSVEEKALIEKRLAARLTLEKMLTMQCDEDRSQLRNKDICTKRFLALIEKAIIPPKVRKATKVPKSVVRARLKEKKSQSELKQSRRKPEL
jgi:ribosome-associated protein